MDAALNAQISMEGYASYLYLSMASWCEQQGMEGSATFLYDQSEEERQHMLRIFHYVNEVGGAAFSPGIAQPPSEFDSIQAMFQTIYEQEKKVTQAINDILKLSYTENDHATLNFLQWYVEEQREEEALIRTILDKIKLIGDSPQSLYFIDMEIEKINKAAAKASANESAK